MDSSLKPDPLRKGSYFRRLEDIERALQKLEVDSLPSTMRFFVYYFSCEKIARGIVGITSKLPATDAYHRSKRLKLIDIKNAAHTLSLKVTQEDLEWIFADFRDQGILTPTNTGLTKSARYLRNMVTHDFGPFNVAEITKHAPFHNPKMEKLLGCITTILEYQRLHFSEVK